VSKRIDRNHLMLSDAKHAGAATPHYGSTSDSQIDVVLELGAEDVNCLIYSSKDGFALRFPKAWINGDYPTGYVVTVGGLELFLCEDCRHRLREPEVPDSQ
jgi:hypothetical protein